MERMPQTIGQRSDGEAARARWADLQDSSKDSVARSDLQDSSKDSVPSASLKDHAYIATPESSFDGALCNRNEAIAMNAPSSQALAPPTKRLPPPMPISDMWALHAEYGQVASLSPTFTSNTVAPGSAQHARTGFKKRNQPKRKQKRRVTATDGGSGQKSNIDNRSGQKRPPATAAPKSDEEEWQITWDLRKTAENIQGCLEGELLKRGIGDNLFEKFGKLFTSNGRLLDPRLHSDQESDYPLTVQYAPTEDEVWNHRLEKRMKFLEDKKATLDTGYQAMNSLRSQDLLEVPAPSTPDAHNRLHKSQWEESVKEWLTGLKKWAPPDGDA